MNRKALIVGASGIIGQNLARHLGALGGWEVIGLSRRPRPGDDSHIAADLRAAGDCRTALSGLSGITHLFFAARLAGRDPAEEQENNRLAVANVMDGLEPVAAQLQRVCLVHGTKWYGSHLGPYRTPAKEDDARHMPPNIYYGQYDEIVARQQGRPWRWSTLRPHTIWGRSAGTGSSIVMVIAIYAAISRELGLPLRFPGTQATYDSVSQATHVDILNKALVWAATDERCANQSFNITNGDQFRWRDLWPRIAALFAMEAGSPQTVSLATYMKDKEALWARIVERHGLRRHALGDLVDWGYGDGLLACGWDDISSVIKARAHGFREAIHSEEAFLATLSDLVAERFVPDFHTPAQ